MASGWTKAGAVSGGLLALFAVWWLSMPSSTEPTSDPRSDLLERIGRARDMGTSQGLPEPLEEAEKLPPLDHSRKGVIASMSGFQTWLDDQFPEAEATFLGVDCPTQPCLVGWTFNPHHMEASRIKAFFAESRVQVEDRLGVQPTHTHMDEDVSGRQYIWVYYVPPNVDDDTHAALIADAQFRHHETMGPLKPPVPPAVPGKGEPGYEGP